VKGCTYKAWVDIFGLKKKKEKWFFYVPTSAVTRDHCFRVIPERPVILTLVRHHDSPHMYSEADIKGILGFLADNIYVAF
jgi:hypothetical protein